MNKHSFLAATFVALLSTAAFAQITATYIITGSEGQFTAARDGVVGEANKPIQTVINAIISDIRTNGVPSPLIQFGENDNTLDIGENSVTFSSNTSGHGWPGFIQLSGKIKSESSNYTIYSEISIDSRADIANVGEGYAIRNENRLGIYGGTVSAPNSPPVYHNNGAIPLVLGGSPSIPPNNPSGTLIGSQAVSIYIVSGKLEVAPGFVPGTEEIYRIRLKDDISAGRVVVVNGAAYADNFRLAYGGWGLGLVPNDAGDLVIGGTAPIIKSKVSSGFGIVLNDNSLQVVGISQATSVHVYDLRGNVVVSRTALPNESVSVSHLPKGVYVAKVGDKTIKVVR